jgi:hypothetical protein
MNNPVLSLPLDRVVVAERLRPVNADYVELIAASMGERGQDTPIKVGPPDAEGRHRLIAGGHRVAAAQMLGWAKIDAIVPKVKDGGKIVVSGYHDSTGNLEQNQELAKQRALAIRDAIKAAAGIGDERFDMRKPEVTTGSPDNAEARRVEVGVM